MLRELKLQVSSALDLGEKSSGDSKKQGVRANEYTHPSHRDKSTKNDIRVSRSQVNFNLEGGIAPRTI